jgi:hypothetical protein
MCRVAAAEVLAAAAARVSKCEALAAAEQTLQRVLEGAGGAAKVRVVPERAGLLAGITALASAPAAAWKGSAEGPALAAAVTDFLSANYK